MDLFVGDPLGHVSIFKLFFYTSCLILLAGAL
jgi:hypothetical protein